MLDDIEPFVRIKLLLYRHSVLDDLFLEDNDAVRLIQDRFQERVAVFPV